MHAILQLDMGATRTDVVAVRVVARSDAYLTQSQDVTVYLHTQPDYQVTTGRFLCEERINFTKLGDEVQALCPSNSTGRYITVVKPGKGELSLQEITPMYIGEGGILSPYGFCVQSAYGFKVYSAVIVAHMLPCCACCAYGSVASNTCLRCLHSLLPLLAAPCPIEDEENFDTPECPRRVNVTGGANRVWPSCFNNDCSTWGAQKAIDGFAVGLTSLARTSRAVNPWVQVDMGQLHTDIVAIRLAARSDSRLFESQNLTLYVSDQPDIFDPFATVEVIEDNITFDALGQEALLLVPDDLPFAFRYITVLKQGDGILSLQEIAPLMNGTFFHIPAVGIRPHSTIKADSLQDVETPWLHAEQVLEHEPTHFGSAGGSVLRWFCIHALMPHPYAAPCSFTLPRGAGSVL